MNKGFFSFIFVASTVLGNVHLSDARSRHHRRGHRSGGFFGGGLGGLSLGFGGRHGGFSVGVGSPYYYGDYYGVGYTPWFRRPLYSAPVIVDSNPEYRDFWEIRNETKDIIVVHSGRSSITLEPGEYKKLSQRSSGFTVSSDSTGERRTFKTNRRYITIDEHKDSGNLMITTD